MNPNNRFIQGGPLHFPGPNLPVPKIERVAYRVQMIQEGPELFAVCIPELTFDEERPELYLVRYPKFLRLNSLFVPEVVRRKGLARLMIKAAINCAQRVKLPVYLDVLPYAGRPVDFPDLFAFYESCGFRRFEGHPSAMVYELPEEAVAAVHGAAPLVGAKAEALPV